MSESPKPSVSPEAVVAPASQTEVYAIHGADPEVLAYAMAKYSRSSLTMKESLAEISSQRAEQFLNTFYFAYGHRSIADLAHIPFAIERLSLLAAIVLVDEQRWDGQERSTRYQDFRRSGWTTPANLGPALSIFQAAVEDLFDAYDSISAGTFAALTETIARPKEMKPDAYARTLRARAFDTARYLLPLATNTSLGQIVNARTLETQVSRLLSSEFAEIRSLGEQLRTAAASAAWNPHATAETREVKTAPTLVKYAAPNAYQIETRAALTQAAEELMNGAAIAAAPVVDLIEDDKALEVEIATALLYPHCHYSYRQLRETVSGLSGAQLQELIHLGTQHRGRHDELLRSFSIGRGLRFDILMDIGGFRDMHRHRRCTQLVQSFTDAHGYELPETPGQPSLAETGLEDAYRTAMDAAHESYRTVKCYSTATKVSNTLSGSSEVTEAAQSAQYLLPLGTRCRSLFQMDFAESLYIAELRSGVAGHYSYRRVAWEMYLAVQRKHPALAELFRIEDVTVPINLLQR